MDNEELKVLSDTIKHELKENTVVVFQSDNRNVKDSLHYLDDLFKRFNIVALGCPSDVNIVVIPQGSGVEIK